MFDFIKKDYIPSKKEFKETVITYLKKFGYVHVKKNSLHILETYSKDDMILEFLSEKQDLFGIYIVYTLNKKNKLSIRINLAYNNKGIFSTIPAVYKYFTLDQDSFYGIKILKMENIKNKDEFYKTLFDTLDNIPTIIEKRRDALEENVNNLISQKQKISLIKKIFINKSNTELIFKTINISSDNLLFLFEILGREDILPNEIKDIFIF